MPCYSHRRRGWPTVAERNTSSIGYVWFDQDDTLYSYHDARHRAMESALAVVYEHYPQTRHTLGVDEMIQIRLDVSDRCDRAGMDFLQAREEAFRETLGRHAQLDEPLAERLTEVYYEALHTGLDVYPDTVPCLNALRNRFALGILSNGMALIEELGIAGHFEHRIYALELGLYKPDPAIFDHAMTITGAGPEECLLVGDNRICDVVGAREVGWHGVWLNRNGRSWDIEAEPPEHEIASLAELPGVIDGLCTDGRQS